MKLPEPIIIDPQSVPSLNWGIIGPGAIAETFVAATQKHTSQRFIAVASRTAGRAEEFAGKFDIPKTHASYQDLVADEEIDAIYISSHMSDHFEHAMLAIAAGKNILVEKPITYLPEKAEQIFAAAREAKVLAMEAMWTRYLPQSTILRQLLQSGDLGKPELLTASFCADNRAVERLWKPGGGGIVFDMGIYPIAIAQEMLGEPNFIAAKGKVRPDGMDEESYSILKYESGASASLTMSGMASLPILASCSFENAVISLGEPFFVPSSISLKTKDFYPEHVTWVDESGITGHEGLSYQATWFAKYLSEGKLESDVHTHSQTVANVRTAFEICQQIGAKPF
jgi:predicted dehydrogenase